MPQNVLQPYTPPEMVQAIIAGGEKAILTAVEGAEDGKDQGGQDLNRGLLPKMFVVGVAAAAQPICNWCLRIRSKYWSNNDCTFM